MRKTQFIATTFLVCGFAFANTAALDNAATSLELSTDHLHETAHRYAPGSHIDIDAAELASQASYFHEEVHHGHPLFQLQAAFGPVRSTYSHLAHTVHTVHSSHIRQDARLVGRDIMSVEHALYWGGGIHGGHGGHGGIHF